MGDDVGDLLAGQLLALHPAQLERLLGVADAVHHVAALGVVDQTELEVRLGDLVGRWGGEDHVHALG